MLDPSAPQPSGPSNTATASTDQTRAMYVMGQATEKYIVAPRVEDLLRREKQRERESKEAKRAKKEED